jgi:hypothetical protein
LNIFYLILNILVIVFLRIRNVFIWRNLIILLKYCLLVMDIILILIRRIIFIFIKTFIKLEVNFIIFKVLMFYFLTGLTIFIIFLNIFSYYFTLNSNFFLRRMIRLTTKFTWILHFLRTNLLQRKIIQVISFFFVIPRILISILARIVYWVV